MKTPVTANDGASVSRSLEPWAAAQDRTASSFRRLMTMTEHGLWFIREGAARDDLGKWEVWFRPLHSPERRHGNFPTRDQALEVVSALNEHGRRGQRRLPDPEEGYAS